MEEKMRPKLIIQCLVLVITAGLIGACAPSESPDYWPGADWRTSTPEAQGLDSTQILKMLQTIQARNLGIHSVLIIRHGFLVSEVYFPPYQPALKHPAFSMTKSVTSIMAGKALEEGYMTSLQQSPLDFFPDIDRAKADRYLKELTVEHLLTMSAGYNTTTLPNLTNKPADFDTGNFILTYDSVLWKPGTTFFYDNGLPYLMSIIIQKTTGLTLREYAQQKLFKPLAITQFDWPADPQGHTPGNSGLMLKPRDMAKIGYLYLQHGRWNGAQLVPEQWVTASSTKHIETKGLMNAAEDDGYGYGWWIDAFGGYSAHGFGGQYIFVLPKLDMVVVFTAGLPDSQFPAPKQLVQAYLLPAAQSTGALPANPEALQNLQAAIQDIEHPAQPVSPLPELARQITGRAFTITGGAGDLFQAVTFTFGDGNIYQSKTLWPGDQTVVVTGGLDNIYRLNPVELVGPQGAEKLNVTVRGHWQDDHTFVEQYVRDLSSDIAVITQRYTFTGERVTIDVASSMNSLTLHASGEMVK
jgi:CubicO group peptidase (beta-lactamase class C family)